MSKTTHAIARELLALPDVPLVIECWVELPNYEIVAGMTSYDPQGTAIIWQKPIPPIDPMTTAAKWKFVEGGLGR